jgi:hypothetical protein
MLQGDKIALLALFVFALLTARLIVALKSTLVLSEPIMLAHTGLSASIPTGNGWQSKEQWKYRENTFTLSSSFIPGPGRPTAQTYCQYLLASEATSPQMRFEQMASEVEGAIVKTDQIQTDTLTIEWAHIQRPEIFLNILSGTAKLPNDRQLNIEVHEFLGDTDLAERAFRQIIKSVNFKDNQLLQAGTEIIEKIKSKGLDGFLDNQNQQAFFLIKDSARRTVGFTMDVLIDSGRDTQLNIQAAGLLYIRGRHAKEQVTSFQCRNHLDEFVYKSETYSGDGRSGTEVILEEAGEMTVRMTGARPEGKTYHLNPAAIPNVLADQLFGQMLDDNKPEIVVDIIDADGQIIPTFISAIDAQKDILHEESAAYIFKLELLDGRGFSEHVYLNNQKQIFQRLVQQENIYLLESTSGEDIVREFPEHAEYILQKNRMLK